MEAVTKDLEIEQGSDFSISFTFQQEDGTPINFTGYSIRGQIRKSVQSSAPSLTLTAAITDPTKGIIVLSLTNAQTKSVAAGEYVYDVEIYTGADASVYRIISGQVFVSAEVTR